MRKLSEQSIRFQFIIVAPVVQLNYTAFISIKKRNNNEGSAMVGKECDRCMAEHRVTPTTAASLIYRQW